MVLSKWLKQNNLSFTICWSEQNERWVAYSKDINMKPTGSNFIGLGEGVAQAIESFVAQANQLGKRDLIGINESSPTPNQELVFKSNLKSFSFIEQMVLKLTLSKKVQDVRKSLTISTAAGQGKWSVNDKQTGLTLEYQYLSEAIVANFNANLASINSPSNEAAKGNNVHTTKQKP